MSPFLQSLIVAGAFGSLDGYSTNVGLRMGGVESNGNPTVAVVTGAAAVYVADVGVQYFAKAVANELVCPADPMLVDRRTKKCRRIVDGVVKWGLRGVGAYYVGKLARNNMRGGAR